MVLDRPPKKKTIPAKLDDATRFVCISDTHGRHRTMNIPDGDVLIHSGDISMCGEPEIISDFNDFLGELPHKYKIVISGNHDITLDSQFYATHFWRYHEQMEDSNQIKQKLTNCIYLEDSEVSVNGIRVYGSPWVPIYHDWAFNLQQDKLKEVWDQIPRGIDILITHGPPLGLRATGNSGVDVGDPALRDAVRRVKPVVHVFGHVHAGYGKQQDNATMFINAASVNRKCIASNSPIVFDLI